MTWYDMDTDKESNVPGIIPQKNGANKSISWL